MNGQRVAQEGCRVNRGHSGPMHDQGQRVADAVEFQGGPGGQARSGRGLRCAGRHLLLGGDYWFETFAVPWYAVVRPEILRIPGADWLAVGGTTSYVLFSTGWVLFAISSIAPTSSLACPASP